MQYGFIEADDFNPRAVDDVRFVHPDEKIVPSLTGSIFPQADFTWEDKSTRNIMEQKISILPFQIAHQSSIDAMMEGIASEFEEPIFTAASRKIADVFLLPDNTYWVATQGAVVVGTIGLVKLSGSNMVLKSMFVAKQFRGQGISGLLLDICMEWAIQHGCKRIYLGTMQQFAAGQRFYEKNGFATCSLAELPADFVVNQVDTIFYTRQFL